MKFVRQSFFFLFFLVVMFSAVQAEAYVSDPSAPGVVLPGKWRGVFHLRPGVEVPFNFEIRSSGKSLEVFLVNGDEKFATGNLNISGDSAFIPLALFDNELAFAVADNRLTGVLRRQDKRGAATSFEATKGGHFRFIETGTLPVKDISGRYDVVFRQGEKEEKAVGIFRQAGNRLQATFLRVTGDSRYLDGVIEGPDIALSSFIGSGPVYYKAAVQDDGSIKGEIVTARGGQPFVATRNDKAALPDAYTLTRLKKETTSLQFSFPDSKGNMIGTADERFAGKVLVVTIGGTWCPNCMDEAAFLAPWYEKNKSRGVEVVALQYERDTTRDHVKKVFDRFSKRYNLQYPLLLGGVADKKAVTASLPALDNFLSFPTTLFIDRKGLVRKIHTGFSGPATGSDYDHFIHEFNDTVNELLAEK